MNRDTVRDASLCGPDAGAAACGCVERDVLGTLQTLMIRFHAASTLQDVLGITITDAIPAMGAVAGVVALVSNGSARDTPARQFGFQAGPAVDVVESCRSASQAIAERRVILHATAAEFYAASPDFPPALSAPNGPVAVFPLLTGDGCLGVILAFFRFSCCSECLPIRFCETVALQCALEAARHGGKDNASTAAKRNEKRIDQLSQVLEHVPESIVALDPSMNIMVFNHTFHDRFYSAFGKRPTVGMNLLEALADLPDEQAIVGALWKRCLAGESFNVVRQFGKPHLRRQFSETNYCCIRGADGEVIGAVHTSRDVTERVKIEEEIRRSAARLVEAPSVAQVGSWDIDRVTNTIRWSTEMYRLFEFDPGNGVPTNEAMIARIHPDDVPLYKAMERRGIETGEHRNFDIRVVYSDGRIAWLNAYGRSVKDDRGRVIRTLGTVTDITVRKQMEQALSDSEERQRAIIEQMPIGIIYAEAPDGRIALSNREMDRILGRPLQKFSRLEECGAFCYADGRPMLPAEYALARAIDNGEAVRSEEVLIVREDGSRLACVADATPIRDRQGKIVAGILALSDIDEQKRLQQQFHQAQKMEGIGRLAGGIAHDFNNLLGIIIGYSELIAADLPEDHPFQAQLQTMIGASFSASQLTRQMLTFARQEPSAPRVILLNELVAAMLGMLQPLIGEDVHLQSDLAATTGYIRIDPHQVEQVLVNLVVNARDAMPSGGTLTISTCEHDGAIPDGSQPFDLAPIPYVVLTVRDTGTGMTEDVKAKLFEPFFTTKERGRGTGLGLASVYGIVKQNGGAIHVETVLGSGSQFDIYLPRVEPATAQTPTPKHDARAPAGPATILVAEDEPLLLNLICATLKRAGYTVLEAEDGLAALEIAQQYREAIDLLLTDAIMPRMSGLELAERLRQFRPETLVLLCSGYSEERYAETHPDAKGIHLLPKPFTPQALVDTINVLLARAAAPR